MRKSSKIFIAGHSGMVGTAIRRKLEQEGYSNLIYRTSSQLDLRVQSKVQSFFKKEKPDIVIDAAARVGGILANDQYPWQFIYDNLEIQNNLISSAHATNVSRFIFLGSSCIYPKHAKQPMKEEYLLMGTLEPTNQWYAIAKIAGIKMIQALRKQYQRNYISLMPTNLYGPNDNFDLETSHVLPAMIRKFHEAKIKNHSTVSLWGTGSPRREFLHVDDLAEAIFYTLNNEFDQDLYNIGTGEDISIKELAKIVQLVTRHKGDIDWDTRKPDGTPRKLMDVGRMTKAGWKYQMELKEGIQQTYHWFLENLDTIKEVQIESNH